MNGQLQPRRAKSSTVLRGQALSQQLRQKAPPLPNLSSLPIAPSMPSGVSSRSTSSTSTGPQTPPQEDVRPYALSSPQKQSPIRKLSSGITERLNLVASELESFVEGSESAEVDDNVHVAVRLKPSLGTGKEVWTCDPLRSHVGGKLGDFFYGSQIWKH
jgi:hypothetical protein